MLHNIGYFRALACKLVLLCTCIMAASFVFSADFSAFAAGSRNLTATQQPNGTWVSNPGYRPYTEWYSASTAEIYRHQILKVYVNSGETLYFGSSVANGVGGDIVVRKPDGTLVPAASLDVTAAGVGYINTRAKEMAGPNYPGSGNTGGYTPLSLLVDQTGVWEFEFHSTADGNGSNGGNPVAALTTAAFINNQGSGTVAAWDITVVKNVSGVNTVVPGRVFTNFLSLNMGGNMPGTNVLEAVVYVLTKDGYVYQTDFNGMDPFGFIFFANNRGLINSEMNTSLYQSGVSTSNDMLNIVSNGLTVQFHSPVNPDTPLDSTYKIFFEVPASDLPTDIMPVAYAPGKITNFRFVGYAENQGYVGNGGYFYFDASKTSSFQIKLDLTNFQNADGTISNRGIVYLANACVEGENRIFWDGRDEFGQIVPAGTYSGMESGISISIIALAGEYHFPMLDVENNRNGIIIKMITNPLNSDNEPIPVSDEERSMVYYNNSYIPNIVTEFQPVSQRMLSGMDSTLGASKFGTKSPYSQGDFTAIDLWSFYKGDSTNVPIEPSEFVLEDIPSNIGSVRGFTFYDTDRNGVYKMVVGDYALAGVTVQLYQAGVLLRSAVSDATGGYYFDNLDYGVYEVRTVLPYNSAECTTSNLTQNVTISAATIVSGWVQAADVGFHYARTDRMISVHKAWTVDRNQDPLQPESILVHVIGLNGSVEEVRETVVLSDANGWQYTFNNLPKFAANGVTILTYSVSEDPISGYHLVGITTVTTTTEVNYTITNTPKGQITLTKVDENDPLLLLEGAEFELWLHDAGGGSDTLVSTYTTDADGEIFVSDLDAGTYYFVETAPPPGYTLDPMNTVTADIPVDYSVAGYAKRVTVENRQICHFTLTKTITEVSIHDETFIFEVTGPEGTCFAVITIPAGQTTASLNFVEMPVGTYVAIERNSNWRYSIQAASTTASDGVNTYAYSGGQLSMLVDDGRNNLYRFHFTNRKTIDIWVSGHNSVTNTMQSP